MSDFPPIAEYAFLSDCENSCLIAPDGSVEWLCLPRPDSPSVFGALLDRGAGSFRFGPSNTMVPHHRRYVPGTMVVETTWHTPSGWLVVNDLLVIRKVDDATRRPGYRRAPTDSAASGVLLRTAKCISGKVEIDTTCVPLFEYGASTGQWAYDGDGYGSVTRARLERRTVAFGGQQSPPRHRRRHGATGAPASSRARRASSPCRGAELLPTDSERGQPGSRLDGVLLA